MRLFLALVFLAFAAGCADGPDATDSQVFAGSGDSACGDGLTGSGEECDDGVANSAGLPDACRADCTRARCGDGVVDSNEACDSSEGCSDLCSLGSDCGNLIVDEGEECDDDGAGCSELCTLIANCGDGVVDPEETCDDGNQQGGDGCAANCNEEGFICGDGVIEGREECDDGNLDAGDECTDSCLVARCGDGRIHVGREECDEGSSNGVDSYVCNSECLFPACGDGVVDPEEACDDGSTNSLACLLCGGAASEASLVNLLSDGREVSLFQQGARGAVLGPVPSFDAASTQPVFARGNSVDLLLSDGTRLDGVETEFGMGPGDHYSFIVFGTGDDVEVRVVREVESNPPDDQVRIRVMNALAGETYPVSLQESFPEFESEYLLFVSVFGEMTLDITRAPDVLDVRLTIHSLEPTEFQFLLGQSMVGEDNSIFVTGTSAEPVLIRTTTTGGVTIAEGVPVAADE